MWYSQVCIRIYLLTILLFLLLQYQYVQLTRPTYLQHWSRSMLWREPFFNRHQMCTSRWSGWFLLSREHVGILWHYSLQRQIIKICVDNFCRHISGPTNSITWKTSLTLPFVLPKVGFSCRTTLWLKLIFTLLSYKTFLGILSTMYVLKYVDNVISVVWHIL